MLVLFIRTIILFVIVITCIRVMGKRTISELQASELVITLLISDIAAVPMQEIGVPLASGIIPILVLTATEVFISCLMMKNARFGRLINGMPVVVINKGELDQSALRRLRMTNEDLFEGLRKKDIFDISSVNYAIVETDGTLSVLQKARETTPTASEMGIEVSEHMVHGLLVSDGDIDEHSVQLFGWSEEKIHATARNKNIALEDIFIMTGNENGDYRIIRKKKEEG